MTEIAKRTSQGLPVFPAEILDDILIFTDDLRIIMEFKKYISNKDLIRILDKYIKSEIVYDKDQLEILELMFELNYEVPWDNNNFHYKLTEAFMLHYEFIFNLYSDAAWREICRFQRLTEKTIRHFINKVDWLGCSEECRGLIRHNYYGIYQSQDISSEFIAEFENRIHPDIQLMNYRVSPSDLRKYSNCSCTLSCCNKRFHVNEYENTCWFDFSREKIWVETWYDTILIAAQLEAANP